jgi:hypothetical protein
MRRHILLPFLLFATLLGATASVARSQDLDLPIPPGAEDITPDGFIPEGTSVPAEGEFVHGGFPIGAPVSMIDVPPTPVPYPGVELWEGFCNHHDGLSDVCCDCRPCAWGSIGILWLQRDEGDTVTFAENDDGVPQLQSSEFGLDHEAGLRLTYGREVHCIPVELTYFGTHNWNSSIGVIDDDDLFVPLDVFPNGAFSEADFVGVDYSTDLHSFELNALQYDCCRDVTLLAGLRFISIDEELGLLAEDSDDGIGLLSIDANNYLFGPQIGGAYDRTCGRWTFSAIAKAGVLVNFSEANIWLYEEDVNNDPFTGYCKCENNDVAFVGELLIGGSYHLGAGFSLQAGYQLTWINGVVLAPDLFGNNSPDAFVPPAITTDSDALYDGAYLGLGWTR